MLAGRPSLHVVEKHQEVERRNAAADARWARYEAEIGPLRDRIADIARELRRIPQRLVEAAERVRDRGRGGPERDYGGHER